MSSFITAILWALAVQGQRADPAIIAREKARPPIVRTVSVAPPPFITPTAAAPAKVTISSNGQSIIVDGALGEGTAERLATIIAAAPHARTVVLHSTGGLLGEAAKMAEVVKAGGLNTYVESRCLSACTLVLLGGKDRAASPNAKIGFHRPIFMEVNPSDLPSLLVAARRFYDEADVSPTFTDRTFATPHDGMWYPKYEEMLAAKVLTRQTAGGETSAAYSQIASVEALRAELRKTNYWRLLEGRYPEVADRALAAAWKVKLSGGNDSDISSAARGITGTATVRAVSRASDQTVNEYLDLVLDQVVAARALSYGTCANYLDGKLNIALALPPELTTREMHLIERAFTEPAGPEPMAAEQAEKIIGEIVAGMPQADIDNLALQEESVSARCDGTIALFRAVAALPDVTKLPLARYLFASDSE